MNSDKQNFTASPLFMVAIIVVGVLLCAVVVLLSFLIFCCRAHNLATNQV